MNGLTEDQRIAALVKLTDACIHADNLRVLQRQPYSIDNRDKQFASGVDRYRKMTMKDVKRLAEYAARDIRAAIEIIDPSLQPHSKGPFK